MTLATESPNGLPIHPKIDGKSVPDNRVFHANVIVDGVLRYPPTGIKVLVIGGGVAGLMSAIECWRKGHEVEVVEKEAKLSQHGDVIAIGPSAWTTLHRYPTMLQEYDKIGYAAQWRWLFQDGTDLAPPIPYEYNRDDVPQHAAYPLYIKSILVRSELCNMLYSQCRRLSIPITFDVNITTYSEDTASGTATAISSDGRRFTGDVVVAADGITTKSHSVVLGKPVRAQTTGMVICRCKCPMSLLQDVPRVREVQESLEWPEVRAYGTPAGRHYIVAICPNFICLGLTLHDDGTGVESWSASVDNEYVLSQLGDLDAIDPLIVEVVKRVPKGEFMRWLLAMRSPQQKWTSAGGHIIQVGDSAHSFVPTSGNGAATALESAISIAECLRLGGKDGISISTKVHELLRFERASIIQRTGIVNRRELASEMKADTFKQGKWHWNHNPEEYATENFERARAHIENGSPFENTNLPPGHKYQPWTLESEREMELSGIFIQDLKTNGDWSIF